MSEEITDTKTGMYIKCWDAWDRLKGLLQEPLWVQGG